ncbi:MAG: SDR family oxidoreductase [Rhodospirillales bacterium]|nr:SDR family oxidoreductase [Rhodospirillales bacterium]
MKFDFSGKNVVLTGGAGDIGVATAELFLDAGATTLLIDNRPDALADATKRFHNYKSLLRTACSSLETPAAATKALTAIEGPIFALVYLAGVHIPDPMNPDDHTSWDKTMASNLTAAYDTAMAFKPRAVTDEPSRLVYITSLAASSGTPREPAYSASKAGMLGLARALAKRWAPDVLVNSVAPGIIETRMTAPHRADPEYAAGLLNRIVMRRFGKPSEVASVIGFLCSPGASYMTGQMVHVNGGAHFS